ncbi:MAG: glycosyltransferase, partial [Bdellovibrionales bacterium]|nr:glycosyltransferase [Bdellovibrionales bacterium]
MEIGQNSAIARPKVALCGIRGIPACYGGFETFAEELCPRLVERGYEVVVYGRSHVISHSEPLYKGVELRLLPAPKHKYLETPVHTIRSFLDLWRRPVDCVLLCNAANSPFIPIARLRGIPV